MESLAGYPEEADMTTPHERTRANARADAIIACLMRGKIRRAPKWLRAEAQAAWRHMDTRLGDPIVLAEFSQFCERYRRQK